MKIVTGRKWNCSCLLPYNAALLILEGSILSAYRDICSLYDKRFELFRRVRSKTNWKVIIRHIKAYMYICKGFNQSVVILYSLRSLMLCQKISSWIREPMGFQFGKLNLKLDFSFNSILDFFYYSVYCNFN